MRGILLAAAAMLSAGCATTQMAPTVTTLPISRVAFTSLPNAATALQGTTGVGLRASTLPGVPVALKSNAAVAFPLFQPDLSALVKVGKSSYLGGRIAVSSSTFGVASPAGLIAPHPSAMAFDVALGGGTDFHFSALWGLSLSGELGLAGTSVTKRVRSTETAFHTLPTGRATLGFIATPGKFRIYAGGTVSTMVWNDATGVLTETCQVACSSTETGALGLTAIGLAGGGVRWQANELISLALEAWVPLSDLQRSPPVISFTFRLGDFGTSPPPPRPLPPPPPPPSFTPDAEEPPPQL